MALVLILAQVTVFNHICLFGVAVPFAFLYIILALPLSLSVNWVLTIAFATGLTIDIFSDTAGLYALGCTVAAALRRPVLNLYMPRGDELTDPLPRADTLGAGVYLRYVVTETLLFCTVVYLADRLSLRHPLQLLLGIAGSTLLTSAIIPALDYLTSARRHAKRL